MADKLINKRPFNFLSKIKQVFGGANSDKSAEILGAGDTPEVIDSLNTRIKSSDTGSDISRQAIGGETIKNFELVDDQNSDYVCIGSCTISEKLIEFWTDKNEVDNDIITIDGIVKSKADWKFNYKNHLQIAINENAQGGEIYATDDLNTPFYLLLKDIEDNYTQATFKYFEPIFNRKLYEINLYIPTDQIVFDSIQFVGAGSGLPVGQYAYSHRYVSFSGDRSEWSPYTPLAFIPENYVFSEPATSAFPFLKTLGNEPAPDKVTPYGLKLKVRVNNIYDYDYIEIKRVSYNSGQGIGYTSPAKIVKSIPISKGQLSIVEYIDSYSNQNLDISLSESEEATSMSVIERAKSVRYMYNKVEFGNIVYASRELVDNYSFKEDINGNAEHFPIVKNIGVQGFKKDTTHCYYKSYMNGEKYGFMAVFWDGNFQKSFAVPIKGIESFQFPNRRDKMDTGSLSDLHSDGAVIVANTDSNIFNPNNVTKTFEVVDCTDMRQKAYDIPINPLTVTVKNIYKEPLPIGSTTGVPQYLPYLPKSPFDYSTDDFRSPTAVILDATNLATAQQYNPYMFAPRYNSLGLGISGLETYPDWAKAVSIVRTKPAGRVICQGIGFYKFKNNTAPNGRLEAKYLDRIICCIPDIENGNVGSQILDDIKNNPQRYKIQLVAPLGFGAEVYNQYVEDLSPPNTDAAYRLESVLVARVQAEINSKRINVGDTATSIGIPVGSDGYVSYAKWRNQYATGLPINTNGGNMLFDINLFKDVTTETDLASCFEIEVDQDIYKWEDISHTAGSWYVFADVKDVHEPIYMFNIILDEAEVNMKDFNVMLQTGSYTKLEALIGYGNNLVSKQEFELCGEREEDVYNSNNLVDTYIYVDLYKDGNLKRFICQTGKTGLQLTAIDNAILSLTPYSSSLLNQPAVEIHGRFSYSNGVVKIESLNYNSLIVDKLQDDTEVYVRYDNRFPIKVFGGDTFTGMATGCVLSRQVPNGGDIGLQSPLPDIQYPESPIIFQLPYPRFGLTESINVGRDLTDANPAPNHRYFDRVLIGQGGIIYSYRQILLLYDVQCRFAVHLSYGDCYPNVGYIPRPQKWNPSLTPSQQHVFPEYEEDYPNEISRWVLGGLRTKQFPVSIDFSQDPNHDRYIAGSSILIKENTWFPTRVIWSLTRPIQSYNAPSLKAFLPTNVYDISDAYGEIKFLYSERNSEFQENLYAFTEENICLLITRKRTLQSLSGGQLSSTPTSDENFITEQIWVGEVNKGGLPGDYWMSLAEGNGAAYFANRNSVFKFFQNKQVDIAKDFGYFKRIKDLLISRFEADMQISDSFVYGGFFSKNSEYWIGVNYEPYNIVMEEEGEYNISVTNQLRGKTFYPVINTYAEEPLCVLNLVFDELTPRTIYLRHNNYYVFELNSIFNATNYPYTGNINSIVSIGDVIQIVFDGQQVLYRKIDSGALYCRENYLFSFTDDVKTQGWNGIFDYKFDKLTPIRNDIFGSKQKTISGIKLLTSYTLDVGLKINDEDINVEVFSSINPEIVKSVEFIRIRVGSNLKPTGVFFYDEDDILLATGSITSLLLKDYNQFENYIPKHVTKRVRRQGVHLLYMVRYKSVSNSPFLSPTFKISFVSFDYKIIR